MAGDPLYKRAGISAPDPGRNLMLGQKAVSDSIKEALGGVQDLFDQQAKEYTRQNTANVQDYLKRQVQERGLSSEPLDTSQIKNQFGDLINMEEVDATVKQEQANILNKAVNTAGLAAKEYLDANQDEIGARDVFEQQMRKLGADEKIISETRQAWSDSQASEFADIKALKERAKLATRDEVLQRISQDPGGNIQAHIEAMVAKAKPSEQTDLRKFLEEAVEARALETPEQTRTREALEAEQRIYGNQAVERLQGDYDVLKQEKAQLVESGISEDSKKWLSERWDVMGGTVAAEVGDEVTNIFEALDPNNDSEELVRIQNKHLGPNAVYPNIKGEKVEQALAQAIRENFRPGMVFDDLSAPQLKLIEERVDQLIDIEAQVAKKSDAMSKLAKDIADTRANAELANVRLSERLSDIARARRLGYGKQTLKDARGLLKQNFGAAGNKSGIPGNNTGKKNPQEEGTSNKPMTKEERKKQVQAGLNAGGTVSNQVPTNLQTIDPRGANNVETKNPVSDFVRGLQVDPTNETKLQDVMAKSRQAFKQGDEKLRQRRRSRNIQELKSMIKNESDKPDNKRNSQQIKEWKKQLKRLESDK